MNYRAWINRDVLQDIVNSAYRWCPSETGGTLLGYWTHTREVVITQVTTAGPLAQHTASAYVPDTDHDEDAIAAHYHASGRLHTYLGDWHTHPRHAAYLSSKDVRTLRRIANHPSARAGTPIMLIAGGGPIHWKPRLWCYRRFLGRRTVSAMALEPYSSSKHDG